MSGVMSLSRKNVPVIGMAAPDDQPQVMVGPSLESPIGPVVCVGAACSLTPGQRGLALVAHISPDDADKLADQLKEAAAEVRRHIQ